MLDRLRSHGFDFRRKGAMWVQGGRLYLYPEVSGPVESAEVVLVDSPSQERFPLGWRDCMASCVKEAPIIWHPIACWASLTERERARLAMDLLQVNAEGKDTIARTSRRQIAVALLGGHLEFNNRGRS